MSTKVQLLAKYFAYSNEYITYKAVYADLKTKMIFFTYITFVIYSNSQTIFTLEFIFFTLLLRLSFIIVFLNSTLLDQKNWEKSFKILIAQLFLIT